jgi:tRNA(fMet)-specific endonuclease VapC
LIHLLDSDTCIRYLNRQSLSIKTRLEQTDPHTVRLCSVVKAELLSGAHKSQSRERTIEKLLRFFAEFESLPFDDSAAEAYGLIRSGLEIKGTPIGGNDLMIEAHRPRQRRHARHQQHARVFQGSWTSVRDVGCGTVLNHGAF